MKGQVNLNLIFDILPHGVTVLDQSGKMVFANQQAQEMIGCPIVMDEDGIVITSNKLPGRKALLSGKPEEAIIRFRRNEESMDKWSLVKAVPIKDKSGKVYMVVNSFHDLTKLKRSETVLQLLDEISKTLSASLNYESSLRQLARMCVPRLSDWCAIDILDQRGFLQRLAVAHVDPEKIAIAKELQLKYPPQKDVPYGVYNVIRTGKAEVYPEITPEQIRQGAKDPEHMKLINALNIHSAIIVPLRARGKTHGAITFAYSSSGKSYDALERSSFEELAHRAALLLDNSLLFQDAQRMIRSQGFIQKALEETNNTLNLALDVGRMGLWDWSVSQDRHEWMEPFMDTVHPLDRARVAKLFQKVFRKYSPFEGEFRIVDKEGSVRWRHQKGQILLNSLGEPDRMVGIWVDVTDRKMTEDTVRERERMFKSIFETSMDAIIITNNDMDIVDANKAACDLFGYEKSDLVKKSFWELTSGDSEKLVEDLKKMLQKNGSWRGELEIIRENGDLRVVEYGLTSEFISNRNLLMVRDITDRREEERRREHLLTIASHELRTPLASIRAFVDILRRQKGLDTNTVALETLAKIDGRTTVLRELIDDILDMARIREKSFELYYEMFEFDQLLEDTLADIQLTVPRHKIIFKSKTKKNVVGDRKRIAQVITNLVRNAAKYSPGRNKIIVKTEYGQNSLIMSVQDYGTGISKKDYKKIFTLFYRAGVQTRSKVYGLGVGLYITSEIIKAHGGKIWVESEIDKGSTFFVSLPYVPSKKT